MPNHDDEITDHVERRAPELDPEEADELVRPHAGPAPELQWATEPPRRRGRAEEKEERPSVELVEETMREHDAEWHG
ncbi:MAG TPA: hypothetical protein VKV21_02400 [Solirubrobacteraceae bacterium]|nr:hypothetical protein [Solirubrobacteraceae bacterium]